MRRFVVGIFLVTLLLHVPFGMGAAHVLGRADVAGAGWIALAASLALSLGVIGLVKSARFDRPRHALRALLLAEPYFIHWCSLFVALPAFVVGSAVIGCRWLLGGADAWWTSLGAVAAASYALGLGPALWGVVVRRRWVRVRSIDVPIAGLPPAFDGYRIAQLSDLHIGSLCPRGRADRWVEKANALGADLVALTGDYVTSGVEFHAAIAGVLSGLRARDGVVAVMGNHDYFGDGEALVTLLREAGLEVLRNERTMVERAGARLAVAGVDDTWTRRADVERALDGWDGASPLIALAHDPSLFPALAARGASFVLSGHTHWGQIAVPFLAARYNLSRITARYHAGLYRQGGSTLYVSPGLGTTGPPVRMGAPPEITLLRLKACPARA